MSQSGRESSTDVGAVNGNGSAGHLMAGKAAWRRLQTRHEQGDLVSQLARQPRHKRAEWHSSLGLAAGQETRPGLKSS